MVFLVNELTNVGFNILGYYKITYLRSYLDFIITDAVQKPQCIFFSKVPGNGSMKPSILKAHFTPPHTDT